MALQVYENRRDRRILVLARASRGSGEGVVGHCATATTASN